MWLDPWKAAGITNWHEGGTRRVKAGRRRYLTRRHNVMGCWYFLPQPLQSFSLVFASPTFLSPLFSDFESDMVTLVLSVGRCPSLQHLALGRNFAMKSRSGKCHTYIQLLYTAEVRGFTHTMWTWMSGSQNYVFAFILVNHELLHSGRLRNVYPINKVTEVKKAFKGLDL